MTARSTKLPNALVLLLVAFSLLCTKSYAADPTVPPCPTDDNGNQTKCPPYAANNWKNTIPQGSMVTVTTTGNPQLTNQNDTQAQTNNTLNSAVFGVESTLTGSTIAASTSTASSSNPVINITFDTQTEYPKCGTGDNTPNACTQPPVVQNGQTTVTTTIFLNAQTCGGPCFQSAYLNCKAGTACSNQDAAATLAMNKAYIAAVEEAVAHEVLHAFGMGDAYPNCTTSAGKLQSDAGKSIMQPAAGTNNPDNPFSAGKMPKCDQKELKVCLKCQAKKLQKG